MLRHFFPALLCLLVVLGLSSPAAWAQQEVVTPPPTAGADQAARGNALRAQRLLVRAMTQAFLEDHEVAVALLDEALQLAPDAPAILAGLATSHAALGNTSTALFYAERAHQQEPANVHYHLQLAELTLSGGDVARSATIYQELLAAHPANEEARLELARLQTLMGHYPDALATYDVLLTQRGGDLSIHQQRLQLLFYLNDYEQAATTLTILIDGTSRPAPYLRMLANLHIEQEQYEAAEAAFREALARDPSDLATVQALADFYQSQGRPEAAAELLGPEVDAAELTPAERLARATLLLETRGQEASARAEAATLLQQALDDDPGHPELLAQLGHLYYEEERFAEAAPLLHQAVEANPRAATLWTEAALAYLQADDPTLAARVADDGLLLFPGQPTLLHVAGVSMMALYRDDAAIEYLTEATAVTTDDAEARARQAEQYAALIRLYTRQGRYAEAEAAYEKAEALAPEIAALRSERAYSLAAQGEDLPEAARLAEQAVQQAPNDARFLANFGWVLFKNGDLDAAARWLRQALDTERADATAYEHLGDVEAARGRMDTARTFWQEALDRRPDHAPLREKVEGL